MSPGALGISRDKAGKKTSRWKQLLEVCKKITEIFNDLELESKSFEKKNYGSSMIFSTHIIKGPPRSVTYRSDVFKHTICHISS